MVIIRHTLLAFSIFELLVIILFVFLHLSEEALDSLTYGRKSISTESRKSLCSLVYLLYFFSRYYYIIDLFCINQTLQYLFPNKLVLEQGFKV